MVHPDIIVFVITVILFWLTPLIWIIVSDENEMAWITVIQAILGISVIWMIFFNHS